MKKYFAALKSSASVLPTGDKKKIVAVIGVQISLSLLDLVGVALIGIIGAVSITGIQGQQPGIKTSKIISVFHLENQGFYNQVVILSIASAVLLIGRTALSMFFSRKYLRFLARRGAWITSSIFSRLISQNILDLQKRSKQENLFLITEGVRRITIGILGNFVFLISDLSLLLVLTLGLLVVDPVVAIVSFVLFGFVAIFLHFNMSSKAQKLGRYSSQINIESNQRIVEAMDSYREILVRDRRSYYSKIIETKRYEASQTDADLAFLPIISKYVLESAVIIGAFVIAGLQFALNDARHAIATLTLFIAAGSRIGPAIMRVQQGVIQIGISMGSATQTLELIEELKNVPIPTNKPDVLESTHEGFNGEIEIENLSFDYSRESSGGVKNISLKLDAGKSLAIVGSSGAGKSTLVDLILGVLKPLAGNVRISGLNPLQAIEKWPGAISYVPQEVSLINGSIKQNIALGFADGIIDDQLIWDAIDNASLRSFVESSTNGLDTDIGDEGSKVSGGEKQRIGIARAMLSKPKLLILDEATSALDSETESEISKAIQSFKGKVTVIMIAHRLSTVKNADAVLYLESGHVEAIGTFDQVRALVPNFDAQARLMGL